MFAGQLLVIQELCASEFDSLVHSSQFLTAKSLEGTHMHINKKLARVGRVYRNVDYTGTMTRLKYEGEGDGGYYEIKNGDSPAFTLREDGNFVEVEIDLSEDCCWVPKKDPIVPHTYIVEVGRIEL